MGDLTFFWEGVVPSAKIVINHPRTYEKRIFFGKTVRQVELLLLYYEDLVVGGPRSLGIRKTKSLFYFIFKK